MQVRVLPSAPMKFPDFHNLKDVNAQKTLYSRGHTYLIRRGKFFKIGYSNSSICQRLDCLQGYAPYDKMQIFFLYCCESAIDLEKRLHNKFEHKNVVGEWFSFLPQDVLKVQKEMMTFQGYMYGSSEYILARNKEVEHNNMYPYNCLNSGVSKPEFKLFNSEGKKLFICQN